MAIEISDLNRTDINQPTLFLHDTLRIFVGQFCWQTKSVNFVDRMSCP